MSENRSPSSAVTGNSPLRVLLVDDSEDELFLLDDELRQGGYDPFVQRVDTTEAMEAALEREGWHLLIVDYVMPRFSAPAALELYHRLELDFPVIVVSGQMGEEIAVEMMRLGAHDYIVKQRRVRLLPAIARELKEYEGRLRRQQAEEALQQSEQKLAVIAKSAQDAIIMMDCEGRIAFWNPAATRTFGYEEQHVLGRDVHQVLAPEDQRKVATESLQHFLKTGEGTVIGSTVEMLALHKDGHVFPVELSLSHFDAGSAYGAVGIVRDISERKRMEREMEDLATHDALTSFYNRAELVKRLLSETERALRYQRPLSIFFIDLDHFKTVNDRFGHQAGDELLREFAILLRSEIRQMDLVGRYGGEEFVVILPETPSGQAMKMAQRILKQVASHRFDITNKQKLTVTVSIGVGTVPEHARSPEELIDIADSAMYAAKQAGRDRVCLAKPIDE